MFFNLKYEFIYPLNLARFPTLDGWSLSNLINKDEIERFSYELRNQLYFTIMKDVYPLFS